MGNSVGRQAAFGVVQMLGGELVKREGQRDMCPKHETTWDDSCHQDFAGVKVKYLFMSFIDGFNYTSRGGFPFFRYKENGRYKTGRLPGMNTPNDLNPTLYWAEDNCINYDTRSCFARFFNGSTENDVFIFSVGMTYGLRLEQQELDDELSGKAPDKYIDVRSWLISSMVNFRSHIDAVFRGHVFFQTLAQFNKNGRTASSTPLMFETNRVMSNIWHLGSQPRNWHTIDQWAINEGRDHLYNDHVHFNGKLESAMLHQVLNSICPGAGDKGNSGEIWPNKTYANRLVCIGNNNTQCYYGSADGYLQRLEVVPFYLATVAVIYVPDNSSLAGIMKTENALPQIKEGSVVKGYTEKTVYLIANETKRSFPNAGVFAKHGFDFDQLTFAPQDLLNLIPNGPDMS
jgi:hypothetical protein